MKKAKVKKGAKVKFDFEDEQNLMRIEGWARDGVDDKQIAANIGYSDAHFCVLKGRFPQLSKALKNGRAPLDFIIEGKLYRKAMGAKIKIQQAIKVKNVYYDSEGRRCEDEKVEVVDLDQEIPSDTTALIFWLKNRKPEKWNKQPEKLDITTNGKDLIPEKVNLEIVYNQKEDLDLQGKFNRESES